MRTHWSIPMAIVATVACLAGPLYAAEPACEFPYSKQTNLAPRAYQFTFSLYSSPTASTPLWTSGPVTLTLRTPVLVYNLGSGAAKIPATIDFSQQLYVKVVKTNPAPRVVIANREPYPIVPYALSLKAGTTISGSIYSGGVLKLHNSDDSTGGGYALSAVNYSGNTWRPAIYGENRGASAGVYGRSDGWHAVVGWNQSPNWAGVFGYNTGSGYGGWFDSATDHGDLVLGGTVGRLNSDPNNENSDLVLSSNNDVTVRLDNDGGEDGVFRVVNSAGARVLATDEASNVSQVRTGSGLVKAAVYADCGFHSSSIVRSFNNVGGTITIASGVADGRCTIDFGFRVDDRFLTATATDYDYEFGHPDVGIRGATCGFTANVQQLQCYRWNGNPGTLVDGGIMVVIY